MIGGFTYRGIHSSTYGVTCSANSRVLMPQKNVSQIRIPGKSGAYTQTDDTWGTRQETISCDWGNPGGISTPHLIREIAGWLGYPGELVFDSEPDKRYRGRIVSAPPVEGDLAIGGFDIVFEASDPPFAYEPATSQTFTVTDQTPIPLSLGGTVKTPVRITITNTGTTTIGTLVIERKSA